MLPLAPAIVEMSGYYIAAKIVSDMTQNYRSGLPVTFMTPL